MDRAELVVETYRMVGVAGATDGAVVLEWAYAGCIPIRLSGASADE